MRSRKSHFSSGEILVLEREEAESNGCFSKTGVGVGLMATERRKKKTAAEFNIIEVNFINTLDKWKEHAFVISLKSECKYMVSSQLRASKNAYIIILMNINDSIMSKHLTHALLNFLTLNRQEK